MPEERRVDLARAVERLADKVDAGFDKIDERLSSLALSTEHRLTAVETRAEVAERRSSWKGRAGATLAASVVAAVGAIAVAVIKILGG